MKRTALWVATILAGASSASAADLGVVYIPEPEGYIASDWTGFYAGIFGGYAGGNFEYNGTAGAGFPWIGSASGGLLGVQVGADYQINNFVIGGVADLAWTNLRGETIGAGALIKSSLQYTGSLRARAGVAVENALLYAHGGLAFGSTDTSADFNGPLPFHGNSRVGYTLGAGLEYKLTDQVSLFGEYAFTDLGDPVVFSNAPPAPAFDLHETLRYHSVKVGVNYRF